MLARQQPAAVHRRFAHALVQILGEVTARMIASLVSLKAANMRAKRCAASSASFRARHIPRNRHDDPAAVDMHGLAIQFDEAFAAILESPGGLAANALVGAAAIAAS